MPQVRQGEGPGPALLIPGNQVALEVAPEHLRRGFKSIHW